LWNKIPAHPPFFKTIFYFSHLMLETDLRRFFATCRKAIYKTDFWIQSNSTDYRNIATFGERYSGASTIFAKATFPLFSDNVRSRLIQFFVFD
jgi:hypothetical protein